MSRHPKLAAGDAALVYRLVNGLLSAEGRAVIVGSAKAPNLIPVRFDGERRTRLRFVHGGIWQTHPEAILVGARDLWRAAHDPALIADLDAFDPP